MRRVLITGGGGQLATDLAQAMAAWEVKALPHAQLDVTDRSAVARAVDGIRPDVVVNTAAFHRVEECEAQVARAFAVNAEGALHVAAACRKAGAALVHISTDYVFAGDKRAPYLETDAPRPVNVYGLSKVAGEIAIRTRLPRHLIVRTSGLYGSRGAAAKGGNFVSSMLGRARRGEALAVVDDQRLSPTYTRHLAGKIAQLIEDQAAGVFHVTNKDACSWYEFTLAILGLAGLETDVRAVTTQESGARARRPAYSVLGHGRLAEQGWDDMPSWRVALRQYLREVGALPLATAARVEAA